MSDNEGTTEPISGRLTAFKGILIKGAVSLGFLIYLFFSIKLASLRETLLNTDVMLLLCALFLYLLSQLVRTLRWWLLLNRRSRPPFLSLLSLYFIGMFFNQFLPTSIGGDVVRGYYLWKETDDKEHALSSILMERFAGFFMLFVISLLASLVGMIGMGTSFLLVSVFIASLFPIVAMSFFFVPGCFEFANRILLLRRLGIRKKIAPIYYAALAYRKEWRRLAGALLLSLLFQIILILVYYCLSLSLRLSIPAGYFCLLVPMITASAMMPFSLNGLGIREGVSVLLFSRVGTTNAQALSLSFLMLLVGFVSGLVGGMIYPFFRSEYLRNREIPRKTGRGRKIFRKRTGPDEK